MNNITTARFGCTYELNPLPIFIATFRGLCLTFGSDYIYVEIRPFEGTSVMGGRR